MPLWARHKNRRCHKLAYASAVHLHAERGVGNGAKRTNGMNNKDSHHRKCMRAWFAQSDAGRKPEKSSQFFATTACGIKYPCHTKEYAICTELISPTEMIPFCSFCHAYFIQIIMSVFVLGYMCDVRALLLPCIYQASLLFGTCYVCSSKNDALWIRIFPQLQQLFCDYAKVDHSPKMAINFQFGELAIRSGKHLELGKIVILSITSSNILYSNTF